MHERGSIRLPMVEQPRAETERYLKILSSVEQFCVNSRLNHRFVGGSISDFLGPQTKFKIDSKTKTVSLVDPNIVTLSREDSTIKDIDLLVFTNNEEAVKDARAVFDDWAKKAKEEDAIFPRISIKPARYPGWPKQGRVKEFMNSFLAEVKVDDDGQLNAVYCNVSQEIPWETVQPWKIKQIGRASCRERV